MKSCAKCGRNIPLEASTGEPRERCVRCDAPGPRPTRRQIAAYWPRTLTIVARFVGFDGLAVRYMQGAIRGDPEYKRIIGEAFRRRHDKRRMMG